MKNIKFNILSGIFSLLLLPFFSISQPGTLDIRFGTQGKIFEQEFRAAADVIAVQKDGKIIAAGNFYSGVGMHISRYNSDGSLDENFAEEGRFILRDLEGYGIGTTTNMVIQKDDRILIGARSILSAANQDISLIRLNTDGSLDKNFGGDGIVDLAIGPYDDEIGEMALQDDGKILVAGLKDPSGYGYYDNKIPMLLRLNTDGSYDENFGQGGKVIQDFSGNYTEIRAICLLPDGKIIMGGEYFGYKDGQVVMFKYNTDGRLDSSFGNKGIAESSLLDEQSNGYIIGEIRDLLLMPDGKIFACGITAYSYLVIAKFTSDGAIDSSFAAGKGYKAFTDLLRYSYGNKSFISKGNKILLAGNYGLSSFAAYRFLNDGRLDSTFGENGISVHYFDVPSGMRPRGAAVQPDGKIILAGSGANRNDDYSHICMLRLHGDGGIDAGGYVKIKRWMKKNGISWWPGSFMSKGSSYSVQRSADGVNFTTIASANKLPTIQNDYNYEDPSPAKGKNFYRLAYTDEEGKKIYSNIIAIENAAAIDIYPNPVSENLTLQGLSGKTMLSIADINGHIKMSAVVQGSSYQWYIGRLSAGHYLLRVERQGQEPEVKKIYKQ